MKTQNKVTVITGAGSGIGRALAIEIGKSAKGLALCDVHADSLNETVQACGDLNIFSKVVDVSKREEMELFAAESAKHFGEIDIVINNAGVALGRVSIEDVTYEDFEWIMGINFWGMVYGSKAFLPFLKSRSEAALINVSSLFGIMGVAFQVPYCTTKFAIRGFTESLRMESMKLYPHLHVMSVHPGGIKTGIATNSKWVGEVTEEERLKGVKEFERFFINTPEMAANTIIRGLEKQKGRVLIGKDARFLDRVVRFMPSYYIKFIGKQLMRKFKEG